MSVSAGISLGKKGAQDKEMLRGWGWSWVGTLGSSRPLNTGELETDLEF